MYPKRVFTLVETNPNDEIYELCITLKDVPGAIAKTAQVLSDANINIKTGSLFYGPEGREKGFWTSFIDISKATVKLKELIDKLKGLDVVLDVKVEKPVPVAYEVIHFPILHGKRRALVMPVDLFKSLFEEVSKILTPSGFAAVFYNAGKKSGFFFAEFLKKEFNLKTIEEQIAVLKQAVRAIGWGIVEDENIDMETLSGSIRIRYNIESSIWGKSSDNVCHWTRGFIAGYVSAVYKIDLEAVEVKCLASGNPCCEFKLTRKI